MQTLTLKKKHKVNLKMPIPFIPYLDFMCFEFDILTSFF